MTAEERDAAMRLVEFARTYDIPPARVLTSRMAKRMNIADAKLGIERTRLWAMGDSYYLLDLPTGPRVAMFNP